jgi:hypothetical protein
MLTNSENQSLKLKLKYVRHDLFQMPEENIRPDGRNMGLWLHGRGQTPEYAHDGLNQTTIKYISNWLEPYLRHIYGNGNRKVEQLPEAITRGLTIGQGTTYIDKEGQLTEAGEIKVSERFKDFTKMSIKQAEACLKRHERAVEYLKTKDQDTN